MLFCLAVKNNSLQGYYDESNNPATPELVSTMPSNAQLVFWDYYHTSTNIYLQKLQQHRDMGCQDPWIASKVSSKLWSCVIHLLLTLLINSVMDSLCMDMESFLDCSTIYI